MNVSPSWLVADRPAPAVSPAIATSVMPAASATERTQNAEPLLD